MVKKRVTQLDIAKATGVSQATVSQVLNNKGLLGIPADTQRRIFGAAAELGYAPDIAARSLRTGKTQTVASVIPDITNPFYPEFQHGIQGVVDARGYDLILYNTGGSVDKERKSLRSLHERRVDGAIVVLFHVGAAKLHELLEAGTAIVRLVAKKPNRSEWPLDDLYLNNEAAARAATAGAAPTTTCAPNLPICTTGKAPWGWPRPAKTLKAASGLSLTRPRPTWMAATPFLPRS